MFASEKEWKSALLQEIDADQLPVCYGGAISDPIGDPKSPIKVGLCHIKLIILLKLFI